MEGTFFCSSSIKVRNEDDKVVWRSLSGLKRMPGQTWLMWLHQKTWISTGTTGFVWINPLLALTYKLRGRPIVYYCELLPNHLTLKIIKCTISSYKYSSFPPNQVHQHRCFQHWLPHLGLRWWQLSGEEIGPVWKFDWNGQWLLLIFELFIWKP